MEKWGDGLVIASRVENWDPGSTVSWEQSWPGAEEVGSNLARLQSVELGQSWKFVTYAPDIKAGVEWANSKHWVEG